MDWWVKYKVVGHDGWQYAGPYVPREAANVEARDIEGFSGVSDVYITNVKPPEQTNLFN